MSISDPRQASFSYPIDRPLFEILIGHLVHNACDAIPVDRQGLVVITLAKHGDWIRIAVRDNGSGIAEEDIERIFDSGFTRKESGRERGQVWVLPG